VTLFGCLDIGSARSAECVADDRVPRSAEPSSAVLNAFRQGIAEAGYVVETTVTIRRLMSYDANI